MSSLERLIRAREALVDKVKMIKTIVGAHATVALSEGAIESYLQDIERSEGQLETNLERINAATDATTFPTHKAEFIEACKIIAEVRGELFNIRPSRSGPSGQPVQRPTLDLPKFSGDADDWTSFYAVFKASIEDDRALSNAQKLQYLMRCLTGEALGIIKSYPLLDASYTPALALLKNRYSNTRLIVHHNIEKIVSLPQLNTESAASIEKMLDHTYQAIAVLRQQGEHVDHWGTWIAHTLIRKLDPRSRELFEQQQAAHEVPKFIDLMAFLKKRSSSLRVCGATTAKKQGNPSTSTKSPGEKPPGKGKSVSSHHSSTSSCVVCEAEDHIINSCPKFESMTIKERRTLVQSKKLCFNCLRPGHIVVKCESSECRKCQKKHHTMLHFSKPKNEETSATTEQASSGNQTVSAHHSSTRSQVILATAIVKVQDANGVDHRVRALLDPGSQASFVTEDCIRRLKLPRTHSNVQVNGLAMSSCSQPRGVVTLSLGSHFDPLFRIKCNAFVLQSVTGLLPSATCNPVKWEHLSSLHLADPLWYKSDKVDILIGSDIYYATLLSNVKKSVNGSPTAELTSFGWILGGPTSAGGAEVVTSHLVTLSVEELLKRFWELEESGSSSSVMSEEEKMCEEHFLNTTRRNPEGRYIVRLPFKSNVTQLISNREQALRRFKSIEHRLLAQPDLRVQYNEFMSEYFALNHMSKVKVKSDSAKSGVFYLPHHPVLRPEATTTKCRVVFDASAKGRNGISLNDALMVGPKVQQDLLLILIRFRIHCIVLKADIGKMYRQIEMEERDWDYQRILWRDDPSNPVEDVQLQTVTYGEASAPYQATRVLKQLALDEQESFPVASIIVLRDFYMDDLLSGASSTKAAKKLRRQLSELLAKGGFDLRKWATNDPDVLKSIPEDYRETSEVLEFDSDPIVKTLGLMWHPKKDSFGFKVYLPSRTTSTKRQMISDMAKVFDPLGWLSPITVKAKMLYQEIWRHGTDWDEPIPEEISEDWEKFKRDLPAIQDISIPRHVVLPHSTVRELHGFSDASEKAYGAAVYFRSIDAKGQVQSRLIAAKTKVAPTKKVSIPRLELCGAVLLSKLLTTIMEAMEMEFNDVRAWSDSTVVLHWIKGDPNRWQTFVANRVSEIQQKIHPSKWHHVPGKENPADVASRGIFPSELPSHELWWNGPAWLYLPEIAYPTFPKEEEEAVREEQKQVKNLLVQHKVLDSYILERFSSLAHLKRIVALCLRFVYNCRNKNDKILGAISPTELESSLMACIRVIQEDAFPQEVAACKNAEPIPIKSKLRNLNPMMKNDVLRVGGRIHRGEFAFDKKHPAILPANHHLTVLIIRFYHHMLLHGGVTLTLSTIQETFWIVNGKITVRKIINSCVTCTRWRASTQSQLMGDLPAARLKSGAVFSIVGLDFAGPIFVRDRHGRGVKVWKNWIALFVCFSTHAIHLELVEDMSSEACLAAIRAFCGRRGKPSEIRCDCGTNLVGAANELEEFWNDLQVQPWGEHLSRNLADEGIKFIFNPPASPHFGGLWEAAVKSAKFHLRRLMDKRSLTRSEYHVLLIQVEATLNSRPLVPLDNDPDNLEVLTPAHFLVGKKLTSFPEPDIRCLHEGRLSHWQHVQWLSQHFWDRWTKEYLSTLQKRVKWHGQEKNVQIGDVVILKDENLPPLHWKLGRIKAVHPGADGLVRVVTVKTATGELKRPIVKLCVLPVENV